LGGEEGGDAAGGGTGGGSRGPDAGGEGESGVAVDAGAVFVKGREAPRMQFGEVGEGTGFEGDRVGVEGVYRRRI
jgi:hypothetical protein